VFAASDVQAFGVVEVARGLGVDVPEQLSVIGFDDIEIASYVGLTAREKGRAEPSLHLLGPVA
jgi:LacI family transcriptional regulator